jgi:hypothetical protein
MKFLLSALLLVGSCSFKKSNQTLKGHEELYSEPSAPSLTKLSVDEKRIIIASTNDLQGHLRPLSFSFTDIHNKEEQSIRIGGKSIISSYFEILRKTYKNVILVDSGDVFSSAEDLTAVEDFYEHNEYDALTVGLRDFNLKVPSKIGSNTDLFRAFAKSSNVPLLLSNLYELKTARVIEWEGTKSHLIKEVDGIKVGIIGLVPDDIATQTPVNNRVGLYVENMLQSTLRHARLMRSLGADLIVVLTHQGIDCNSKAAEASKLPKGKVNFDPHRNNDCDLNNALGEYLERLPPQLVDVVIGGRNHQKMANLINGTLVMGGYPEGKSFNYAEFVINTKTKKINPEKTVVHQPVFFCHEFFKETEDCYHEDNSVDHRSRVKASFLGQEITPEKITFTSHELNPEFEISKSIASFDADLSYVPGSSGETQLMVIKLSGKELVRVLEEDFNLDRKDFWQPSPFLFKNNELIISISGSDLDLSKTYRILTDLESLQMHKFFVKKVTSADSEALMNHSWTSIEEDQITSKLAARAR